MRFLFRFFWIFNPPAYLLLNIGIYLFLSFFLGTLRAVAGEHVASFFSLVVLVLLMRTIFELKLRGREIAELRSLGTPFAVFPVMKVLEKAVYGLGAAGCFLLGRRYVSLPPDWIWSIRAVFLLDAALVLLVFTPVAALQRTDKAD